MKILLIAGHGENDSGAVANGYKEADLTRELVKIVSKELRKYADVFVYATEKNACKQAKKGSLKIPDGVDYVLEIHFNSAESNKAHGSECYVTSREEGITVEKLIMKELSSYFTLRDNDSVFDGVKRENFLVINTLKNKGISGALLEVCFISNKTDITVYQANKERIAKGIVEGIVKGFNLEEIHEMYYPAFSSKSIVNGLKSVGIDSSFKNRKRIAVANGIQSYTGKADENIKMLELAKRGILKKP